LIYYESFNSIVEVIAREKQVKKYSRAKKIALIKQLNPEWDDLFEEVKGW
jgi:putative endonuclease